MEQSRSFKRWLSAPCGKILTMCRRYRLRCLGMRFGKGLKFEGHVDVTYAYKIRLGDFVKLGKDICLGAWPEGKLQIGDHCYVGRWTIILAHSSVTIGNDCQIAPGCHITDVNHGIKPGTLIRKQPLQSKPIKIGNDVWVGAGCSILPGVTIGDHAVIGARAVVTHDVPESAIVVGTPAKILRYRTD